MSSSKIILSERIEALGLARKTTSEAYEVYLERKELENQARYELEVTLHEMGLKSAKGEDYTASLVNKPSIVITHEQSVIDWLRDTPDIEYDRYIGLRTTEFKALAMSILKGKGEIVPGTEVTLKESLAIKSNKKKEVSS